MFEWLDEQLRTVANKKFHITKGPASGDLLDAIQGAGPLVPESYRQFVLKYGEAKFFRMDSYYLLRVMPTPVMKSYKGETVFQIASTDGSRVYVRESDLCEGCEPAIFEEYGQGRLQKTAPTLEEWLKIKFRSCRKRYLKQEWVNATILPTPFTQTELTIVQARRNLVWEKKGLAESGEVILRIDNRSSVTLPYFSLGVKGPHIQPGIPDFNDTIWISVKHLSPGTTDFFHLAPYRKWLVPSTITFFDLPDPGPEDREQYWEFKRMDSVSA